MNKQQLAAKIWESANQMRSKIEANEYKDYILGFIFYKYLSDNELKFARKEGCSHEFRGHCTLFQPQNAPDKPVIFPLCLLKG